MLFQDKADVYHAYKFDKFATKFRAANSTYEFTNANRIYVDAKTEVRPCMVPMFVEELAKADFVNNPEAARNDINRWVEHQTHDFIKNLLPAGTVDQTTNLVLVNAAYFKGIWENKFNPEFTRSEVFHISPTKRTRVDMMYVEGAFNHGKMVTNSLFLEYHRTRGGISVGAVVTRTATYTTYRGVSYNNIKY